VTEDGVPGVVFSQRRELMRSKAAVVLMALVFGVGMGLLVQPAHAGTIILEGSDAIGYHSGGSPSAAAYRDQVWLALSGSDLRPIAVLGHQPVSAGFIASGSHPIVGFEAIAAGYNRAVLVTTLRVAKKLRKRAFQTREFQLMAVDSKARIHRYDPDGWRLLS